MPIAATETLGLADQPEFLLLKNAGQFMNTMVRCQIDLVLHGHQHYPSFSKVSFPTEDGGEHTIAVVGAGSVAKEGPGMHRSYNLITITDSREISLERKVLVGAQYERSAPKKKLRTYADARKMVFGSLAAQVKSVMRVEKLSRLYLIKGGSGDVDLHERWEGVRAYSGDVPSFELWITSESGFFFTPRIETRSNQNIKWEWQDSSLSSPRKVGRVTFEPPLTKERPIDYEFVSKNYNSFHFNEQDRKDATSGKSTRESINMTVRNAYDLFVLTAVFPEDNFPLKFFPVVHNERCFNKQHGPNCQQDSEEEELLNRNLSTFEEARTIVVSLERPLPGYTYWIYWDLPKGEEQGLGFSGGRARDLIKKFLNARQEGPSGRAPFENWLATVKSSIRAMSDWQTLEGNEDFEIWLHSYDSTHFGLVCVATSEQVSLEVLDEIIKPGQTLIGAAYRRREPMMYSPFAVSRNDRAEYSARVPLSWTRTGSDYSVIWSVPLAYPATGGQRIAVLTLATRANDSRLINFVRTESVDRTKERDRLMGQIIENLFPAFVKCL
jgi:hypothetical protein